jgi:hypothetical protein
MKKKYKIVASRGRWKDDRWTQQYEVNDDHTTNTLTGVQKDNLVLEIEDADQQTYSGRVDA